MTKPIDDLKQRAEGMIDRMEFEGWTNGSQAIRDLLAALVQAEQEKAEAIAKMMISERFRMEDGASHCDDQIVSAQALKALKARLDSQEATIKQVTHDIRLFRANLGMARCLPMEQWEETLRKLVV